MMNRIAVIDLDSVMFTVGHPNKVLDVNGEPVREDNKFVYYDKTEEELKLSADNVMYSILKNCNATHYLGYIKGEGTTHFRKQAYPNYKANRNTEPPKWWDFCKQYLIDNWNAIPIDLQEVDDAVNRTRLQIKDSFIVAIDKDLLSLEGTHYNWRTNIWVTTTPEEALYKFWSDMIVGQPSDFVKGLVGKGEAFVKKLFKDLPPNNYRQVVLEQYINDLGEYRGIHEFQATYKALKILDSYEGFNIKDPIPVPDMVNSTNLFQVH